VTFYGDVCDINISTLAIDGNFIVAPILSSSFTFMYRISILVGENGSFSEQTSGNKMFCRQGSVWTFLTGSRFNGFNTIIYVYLTLPANESPGNNYSLGTSRRGPFTLVVLNDNTFQYFDSIMCFPIGSGSFYDISIWPGGLVPTFEFCRSVGGCGFFLQPDLTVSMVFVNGILNIQFNTMIVCPNANLGLGDGSFNGPFQFAYSVIFVLYGQVAFFFPGFWLPFNSQFNCYPGSFIQADVSVIITIYDSITGVPNNQTATVAPGAGSYLFLTVSANGSTSTSTEGM
jgi:hypothetical protein